MFPILVLVLALGAADGFCTALVGTACTSTPECSGLLYPYLVETTHCVDSECRCASGYFGSEGEMCLPVNIGSPCPDVGGDDFCNAGVENSVCDPSLKICVCPDNTVEIYPAAILFPPLKPSCVEPFTPDNFVGCGTCHDLNGGVCYDKDGDDVPDTCGCQPCVAPSNLDDSLSTGCDTFYAYPGESCRSDNRDIYCLYSETYEPGNPRAACLPDGTLSMVYTCQCVEGYVQVPNPANPTKNICATVINQETDDNCRVCEENEGQCYDVDGDTEMDGCSCPVIRSSPTTDPADACSECHVTIECTSDSMKLCFKEKSMYDDYLGQDITKIYTEGKASTPQCHLQPVDGDDNEWCIQLLHQDTQTCGVVTADSKHWKSYSIWVLFQFDEHVHSAADLCIYGYCTYDKMAEVATGLVDVATQKIRYSTGVSLKPVVAMSISNKFGDDLEEIGASLGEQVQLTLEVTDARNVYTSILAVTCVASNMMSLNHPHAQSAFFLLDGCPEFDKINPPPVFFADPTNPLLVKSTFFSMPKFNGDIVFFHCAVKVCLDTAECAPVECDDSKRRKRNAVENRNERSTHDVIAQLESPDLMQKVVALTVTDPNSRAPLDSRPSNLHAETKLYTAENILQIEEHLIDEMIDRRSDEAKNVGPASMSSTMLVAAVLGSCLVTVVIGAILVLFWSRRRRADRDVKIIA